MNKKYYTRKGVLYIRLSCSARMSLPFTMDWVFESYGLEVHDSLCVGVLEGYSAHTWYKILDMQEHEPVVVVDGRSRYPVKDIEWVSTGLHLHIALTVSTPKGDAVWQTFVKEL